MGDRAGHIRHLAVLPLACALDGHGAIAQLLFHSVTVSRWGPGDLGSWLPCSCPAHDTSIAASKQGHLRGHCRDAQEKALVLTTGYGIWGDIWFGPGAASLTYHRM